MRPILFAAPVLLAIAGCQATRNAEIANSVTAGRADCAGRQFSTMVAWAECANAAELPLRGTAVAPDLFDLRAAARLALAEKVDRKQITMAEAKLQFAGINSQVVGAQQGRNTSASIAASQARAAAAADSGTICSKVGNSTICY